MDIKKIENEIRLKMNEKRLEHTFGVAKCAKELAERFGADAESMYIAGLLHDITKQMPIPEQLLICEKNGIILSDMQKSLPQTLHAITGAVVAENEFNVSKEISNAIRWHTTGREHMTREEKIIWLADLIEPTRDFPGIEDIRALAQRDIDLAMIEGISCTVKYLLERKQIIDPSMIDAYNSIVKGIEV